MDHIINKLFSGSDDQGEIRMKVRRFFMDQKVNDFESNWKMLQFDSDNKG